MSEVLCARIAAVTELRVATLNILMGGRRGEPLHEGVRTMAPDVLLVNESPKLPLLWRRRCELLATRWGLRFVGGGRPAGSNMVLVRPGIRLEGVRSRTLRIPPLMPRRGIVAVQLRVDGKLFGAISCHLSLTPEARVREVEEVLAEASRLRGPVVVGGDLNERPNGPSWARFRQAGFADHGTGHWRTFPVEEPGRRIDALLVRGPVRVLHHGDPGVPEGLQVAASDHRAVLAVLTI